MTETWLRATTLVVFCKDDMQNTPLEHPSEEMLERYVLHQSTELELDTIETHVLACESCVARLEDLEAYIGILRQAHQELQLEEAKQPVKESTRGKNIELVYSSADGARGCHGRSGYSRFYHSLLHVKPR